MNAYTVFLLDDDTAFLSVFQEELQKYLLTLPYSFSLLAFSRCADLAEAASQTPPDLIISDIALAGENRTGIDFLRAFKEQGSAAEIIFLSGYLHFALDVFELHPLYFILKSEYKTRIPFAFDIFLSKMQKRQTMLPLSIGNSVELVSVDTVIYCERIQRRTVVHCTERSIAVATPLIEIYQRLPAGNFVFTHQSILVNLRYVARFKISKIVMTNGAELPVSRSRTEEFRAAMAAYLKK